MSEELGGHEDDGLIGGLVDPHSLCVTIKHYLETASDRVDDLRWQRLVSAGNLGKIFYMFDLVEQGLEIAKTKGHMPVELVGAPLTMLNDFLRGDKE